MKKTMTTLTRLLPGLALLSLAACTTMPSGPNVMVLPGTGKSFEQFRGDDYQCRSYAQSQLGGATPTTAMQQSGVASAAVGTLLGAAAGAAANGGTGAAVGAGAGMALGGLAGTSTGQVSGYNLQRRYDYAYLQCMYAQGHRIPSVGGSMVESHAAPSYSAPAPSGNMPPPPPPGMPPAPPPR
jgi:hypothetical protein